MGLPSGARKEKKYTDLMDVYMHTYTEPTQSLSMLISLLSILFKTQCSSLFCDIQGC